MTADLDFTGVFLGSRALVEERSVERLDTPRFKPPGALEPLPFRLFRYRIDKRTQVRMIHIQSELFCYVAVVAWPDAQWNGPVYTFEMGWQAGVTSMGLIDAVTLGSERRETSMDVRISLEKARRQLRIRSGETQPTWLKICRSGEEVFSRPTDELTFRSFGDAHLQTFERSIEALSRGKEVEPNRHSRILRSYQRHRAFHCFARRYLNDRYGPTWARRFLRDVVFR